MDAPQTTTGRAIGHVISLVQGGAEIYGGVSAVVGGGGEAVITAPAAGTGVGALVPAAGVVTAGAGAIVTVHGGAVVVNTVSNIFSKNNSESVKGSKSGPEYDKHIEGVQKAKQEVGQLKEQLSKAKGPKQQAPIKEKIGQLEKSVRGHAKEIRQKWPKGRPEQQ